MTADSSDTGAWLRGKLRLAGITPDVPLGEWCDAVAVLSVEGLPQKELREWRAKLNRALWRVRPPDRETWGLLPDQIAETQRLIGKQT